ncbi:hypothetical protein GGS24DRAFT_507467 [Hypoxylon argillaceum]|nr:hypothetical protein GGS24DRAFT_507467 [Hypoxylon argillaceum]
MFFATVISVILAFAFILRYVWRSSQPSSYSNSDIQDIRALKPQNDVSLAFLRLVDDDGAGEWPPKANHDDWPSSLRPYKNIYLLTSPFLATAEPSMDDDTNRTRCQRFRSRMTSLLAEHINLEDVQDILNVVEKGHWQQFSRDSYNGFYSCIACLRHAYRWGTNPVVKVVQEEKQLRFPLELDIPWSYCQRRFGITSPGGNIMANIVCNFDQRGDPVYLVNEGMSEVVQKTELAWGHLFLDSEIKGVPLYCAMIKAIGSFEKGDKIATLEYSKVASHHLRKVFKNIYEHMNDLHVAHSVWAKHISGIHGWAMKLESDKNQVEYGGLSGSQILVFQAVDAFLGLSSYHPDHEIAWHISRNMRFLSTALRVHSFRKRLSKSHDDASIGTVLDQMIKQLRNFRSVHRVRAVRYLSAPVPERVPMTAALSVLELPNGMSAAEGIHQSITVVLDKRLSETV